MPPSALLQLMIDAARAAGKGLRRDFQRLGELEVSSMSGPADLFSQADLSSERTLREMLSGANPAYGFLGEEGGLVPGSDARHLWVVDPLDGTTNFLVGNPAFAVNVALARDGKVIAGVTFAPVLGEMFTAETGAGAHLNGKAIRVSPRVGLEQ